MKPMFSADTQFASGDGDAWRCPRCKGGVHRIRRHTLDRIWNWLQPSWRYRCREHPCGWEGLVPLRRLSERQRHAHDNHPLPLRRGATPRLARHGR